MVLVAYKVKIAPVPVCTAGGDTVLVMKVLDDGANIEAVNETGAALMWAALNGHVPVAKRLLSRRAVVSAKAASGATELLGAADQRHAAVVEILLQKGSGFNRQEQGRKDAFGCCSHSGT